MIPSWMTIAMGEIGVKETVGNRHTKRVIEYHSAVGLKAQDDETAWCASFTGWVYVQAGIKIAKVWARGAAARTWLEFGKGLDKAIPGALMVLKRGTSNTSGHTTFFVEDIDGVSFKGLGGNQSNGVNIATFKYADVLGIRWPEEIPIPSAEQKLRNSGVVRWSGAGLLGMVTLVADNGNYILEQLFYADGELKRGTVISTIAAVVIILSLVGVMYSRIKGANDEKKIAGHVS